MPTLTEIVKNFVIYESGANQYRRANEYWLYHKFGIRDDYSSDEHFLDCMNFTERHLLSLMEIPFAVEFLNQGKPFNAVAAIAFFESIKYGLHRFAEYGKNNPEEAATRVQEFLRKVGIYDSESR